jgi:uncharacterized protein YgiM (DUF1202 family)
VNLRAEPSTSADIVDQISSGIEVEVISGPTEADDITWYEVQVNVAGGSQGWMSGEFLDGLAEPAVEETEPTDAADEGSDGTGTTETTFEVGDTVQLTDDIVRIRAEGNLGGAIINTFDAGTLLEITGEPIDADGYTWYPVELVDDPETSGWVTVDFLEPAP